MRHNIALPLLLPLSLSLSFSASPSESTEGHRQVNWKNFNLFPLRIRKKNEIVLKAVHNLHDITNMTSKSIVLNKNLKFI